MHKNFRIHFLNVSRCKDTEYKNISNQSLSATRIITKPSVNVSSKKCLFFVAFIGVFVRSFYLAISFLSWRTDFAVLCFLVFLISGQGVDLRQRVYQKIAINRHISPVFIFIRFNNIPLPLVRLDFHTMLQQLTSAAFHAKRNQIL